MKELAPLRSSIDELAGLHNEGKLIESHKELEKKSTRDTKPKLW